MKVLGIIPARIGSKGIQKKNIQLLGDLPLIGHTMREASDSVLERIVVSTDSNEILAAVGNCKMHGIGKRCEFPFIRPAELAQDDTPMLDVIVHAVKNLASNGYNPDAVMILQPTAPFRTAKHINEAIQVFENLSVDSLVSVKIVPVEYNPEQIFFEDAEGLLRVSTGRAVKDRITCRQDFPAAYTPNGMIYLLRTALVCSDSPSLYGVKVFPYIMSEKVSVNIDTPEDLKRAREIYANTYFG